MTGDAVGAGHLQHFTIRSGLLIAAFDRGSRCRLAVSKSPFIAGNFAGRAPRAPAIEHHLLANTHDMMRPGYGDNLRLVIAKVGFPHESIRLCRPPLAGRLPALNAKVQMRPSSTCPFLAQYADFLPHLHDRSRTNGRIDGKQMTIAVI